MSAQNKKVALNKLPSLFEVLAHSYFPASFLVGPQFSMKRYQDFVCGKFKGSVSTYFLFVLYYGRLLLNHNMYDVESADYFRTFALTKVLCRDQNRLAIAKH